MLQIIPILFPKQTGVNKRMLHLKSTSQVSAFECRESTPSFITIDWVLLTLHVTSIGR